MSVSDCYCETLFGKKKKFYDAIAEAAKALVPYVEVLYVGFIKILCDSTWMKTCEKTEGAY